MRRCADDPDLVALEAERARLYAELCGVGDFRRGTLIAVFRNPHPSGAPRCG
jgi:hypothetical protein